MIRPIPRVVTSPMLEPEPLHLMKTTITEPKFIQAVIAHGTTIYRNPTPDCVLEFPPGTLIQKQDPSTFHERYMITFADGFMLWASWNREIFLLFEIVKQEEPPVK